MLFVGKASSTVDLLIITLDKRLNFKRHFGVWSFLTLEKANVLAQAYIYIYIYLRQTLDIGA